MSQILKLLTSPSKPRFRSTFPFYKKNNFVKWKMATDVRRRIVGENNAVERFRLLPLLKNKTLPSDFRKLHLEKLNNLPRYAQPGLYVARCMLTSRPRGIIYPWRLSRIVWRDMADHANISGAQRAMW
ncbi:28S ribosomal protein S14, mitochondrial [Intoshia linei]|uniref:28S ribosomal protein S14, mitochondrial n=1 Tax=Intoshia linei TaxID=1819745 RepID=A0A177AX31_9BILA|nr:28S ribosomal protein S14, mitochondrial [Intoshia linei]